MSNLDTTPPARNTRSQATSTPQSSSTPQAATPATEPTLTEIMTAINALKSSVNQQITDTNSSFHARFAQNDERFNDLLGRLAALESTSRPSSHQPIPRSAPVSPTTHHQTQQTQTTAEVHPSSTENLISNSAADVSLNTESGWWDAQFRAARQDGRAASRQPQDARAREAQSGAYNQVPPPDKVLLCNPKHLGEYAGDPALLEDFIGRAHDIARMNPSRAWEMAARAAIPAALKDSAANWHKGLTDDEITSMASLDAYFKAMRKAFPVNRSELRKVAQGRQWDPHKETAMAYSFDKVKLLRQVYGQGADENYIVSETLEGLDAQMRAIVRVPRDDYTVSALRIELGEQEPLWRNLTGTRIGDEPVAATNSSRSARTEVSQRPRTDDKRASGTDSSKASSTPSAPPPSRRGRSIADDFDAKRLGRGRDPESGKELMFYRIPDSNKTMWCHRSCRHCGGDHFDFAHDHCASQPTPSLHTVAVDDYDYTVVEDGDAAVQGSDFH
ncbi:hypothetical protein CF319_g8188 [Tilletia indica]|nr:hypothetical protein CF319_g8188 [Tilletia indica]